MSNFDLHNKRILMRIVAILALTLLPLFAGFFPKTTYTSIKEVSDKSVKLTSALPRNGMSGVVIHNYDHGLEAITSRLIQDKAGRVTLQEKEIIHHDKLPSIKTKVNPGDKVIGGYLYDNVLLLAPNKVTYDKITSMYNKKWVHPDLFALFLDKEGDNVPTHANLATFAKAYQVGLVLIIGSKKAKLLDTISGKIVGVQVMKGLPKKGQAPFFSRLNKMEPASVFSRGLSLSYYELMDAI